MYKNLFSILSLGKIKAKKKEHKEILLETTCHKMVQWVNGVDTNAVFKLSVFIIFLLNRNLVAHF